MREEPLVPHEVRRIYEGRIFSVRIESIRLPKGRVMAAEIVGHPGSVVIVPVTEDGELILVRQYRHAVGRSVWELPAGSLAPGEDEAAAAARECQEEIGRIPSRLERLGSYFPTPGYCDERMTFFKATGLRRPGPGDTLAHQDEDEDIKSRAFPRDRLRQMIADGEVVDLKTVAGLSLVT